MISFSRFLRLQTDGCQKAFRSGSAEKASLLQILLLFCKSCRNPVIKTANRHPSKKKDGESPLKEKGVFLHRTGPPFLLFAQKRARADTAVITRRTLLFLFHCLLVFKEILGSTQKSLQMYCEKSSRSSNALKYEKAATL